MPPTRFTPRSQMAAWLGRNQGPEFFFTTPFVALQPTDIPKVVSLNRPLLALLVNFRGRFVVGVANYAVVAAEAPQTIINRIRLYGTYKQTSLILRDISGATAFAWARLFGPRGSSLYIGNTRQAELSSPLQQVGATFGNIGTYDLDIWYSVVMPPILSPATRAWNYLPFCLHPQDWNDTLQVRLDFGDATSFGTPGAMGTGVFTAYGSGAGSPSVDLYTAYAVAGDMRGKFRTAAVVQSERTITQGVAGVAANIRLAQLDKQKTTNVLVKSGLILTGTSAGVSVFATLSSLMLNRTQIMVDNRPIRNSIDDRTQKEWAGIEQASVNPQGYLNFSFIGSQTPRTAYRGDEPNVVAPGAQFELVTDVLTASADNRVNLIQEEIWAENNDPAWFESR